MKKTYECMVLLDNREVRKGWPPLKEAVSGMFAKYRAQVLSARRWDERRLAFPIQGQRRGTYLLVYYSAEGDANIGIRRDLDLSEVVLRHLISTCDKVPEDAFQPEAEFDVSSIPLDDAPESPAVPPAPEDEVVVESGQQAAEAAPEPAPEVQP